MAIQVSPRWGLDFVLPEKWECAQNYCSISENRTPNFSLKSQDKSWNPIKNIYLKI